MDMETGIQQTNPNEPVQTKINWQDFEVKNREDSIKVELGVKYELGFCSLRQDTIEVVDKERTTEGTTEVKKPLAVLVLGVDSYGGKPAKKELMITSKKLIQTIKTYFERDMLFRRIFQLEKSGSGFQTTYQLIALQDKPKV
jgi:gamma-glutamylcysteine synthetase